MSDENKIIIDLDADDFEEQFSSKGPAIRVLKFTLANETYCIPITQVKEVMRVPEITKVPVAPSFVKGIINLRGEVISVLDIREFFGLQESQNITEPRIVITDAAGYVVGILVDGTQGTDDIEESSIQEPIATLRQELRGYTMGQIQSGDDILTFLDMEKVLKCDEIERLKKGA